MILESMSHLAQVVIKSDADQFTVLIALLIAIIGPFAGTYMFVKNSNKVFGAIAGGIGKVGKAAQKWANGWAKEKQANSRFARARAWNKSLKEANRIERQGKMTGLQGGLNKAASFAAGPSLNFKKWGANAGKYQASAVNRAAIETDKINREDRANAAAAFARNGIAGPLMVEHARSGRVVQEYRKEDGSIGYQYGRKLTQAEHAEAVAWTMKNGKQSERDMVYGSQWATNGRTEEFQLALDAMNDGYFHENGDVARYGNKFGGTMTSGTVGGDFGVNNALLVNMAAGKTAPKAIVENDVAQNLADLKALGKDELVKRINEYDLVPPAEPGKQKLTAEQFAEKFLTNAELVSASALDDKDLQSSIKPEFRGALEELRGQVDPDRQARAVAKFKKLKEEPKEFETADFKPANISSLQPALDKRKPNQSTPPVEPPTVP